MSTYPVIENRSSWQYALEKLALFPKRRSAVQDRVRATPTHNRPQKTRRNHAVKDLKLGTLVQHGSYGRGRILSNFPDGRVIVRFEKTNKSQLIHPSMLSTL